MRAAAPELGVVCAFGQLIKEPLLSELEMLNVHPSLLPRWRGAAPIERAIMAGDAETGVTIIRVDGRSRLRPDRAQRSDADRARRGLRLARRPASPSSAASCSCARSTCAPAGELELTEQDESLATYAEKIAPEERRLDPARPAVDARAHGAGAEPAHRRLPRARRRRAAGRRGRRPPRTARWRPGELAADGGLLRLGCAEGVLRLDVVQPPGQRPMRRRCLPARPPLRVGARRVRAGPVGPARRRPARRVAFEVLRRVFEHGAWADRALPRRRRPPRPRGPRASAGPAARLWRGPAARHRDHLIERLAGARCRRSTPRCSRRSGWASTSCCSPRDARPRRRRPGGRARQGQTHGRGARRGRGRARQRRACAEPPASARSCSPGSRRPTPQGAAIAPLLSRLARRDVVGGARARRGAGADGGDERASRDGAACQHA